MTGWTPAPQPTTNCAKLRKARMKTVSIFEVAQKGSTKDKYTTSNATKLAADGHNNRTQLWLERDAHVQELPQCGSKALLANHCTTCEAGAVGTGIEIG